jgi:hypothetical protein
MLKFRENNITSLDRLEPNEFPQSFSGVVGKHETTLFAPVSGKECVYYRTVCEEQIKKFRYVERDGRREKVEFFVWEEKFIHTESVDFLVVDPQNANVKILVPVAGVNVINQSAVAATARDHPPGTEFADRLKVYFSLFLLTLHISFTQYLFFPTDYHWPLQHSWYWSRAFLRVCIRPG